MILEYFQFTIFKELLCHCIYVNYTESDQDQKKKEAEEKEGDLLVVQWLRICLPMQGTRVRSLVWEDPTCRRATKPVRHNY